MNLVKENFDAQDFHEHSHCFYSFVEVLEGRFYLALWLLFYVGQLHFLEQLLEVLELSFRVNGVVLLGNETDNVQVLFLSFLKVEEDLD